LEDAVVLHLPEEDGEGELLLFKGRRVVVSDSPLLADDVDD